MGGRRPARGAVELGEGRRWRPPSSRSCSARWPRSPCSGSGSSASNTISFLWSCRSPCPGIVTAVALQNSFNRTIDLGPFDFRVGFGFHSLVDRPRHVLRRRRLQQRHRPPAALVAQPARGVGRPRRPARPDVPVRHVPARALGAARRRASSPSRSASTRSSSPRSRPARASRRCRSGSSPTSAGPNNVPLVNVMATFVMVVSIPLAWLAQRLSDGRPIAFPGHAGRRVAARQLALGRSQRRPTIRVDSVGRRWSGSTSSSSGSSCCSGSACSSSTGGGRQRSIDAPSRPGRRRRRPPPPPTGAPSSTGRPVVEPEVVAPPATLRERMARARSALAGAFVGVRGRARHHRRDVGRPGGGAAAGRRRRRRHHRAARRAARSGSRPRRSPNPTSCSTPCGPRCSAAWPMPTDRWPARRTAGDGTPNVWLFVGVNGVGKTTTHRQGRPPAAGRRASGC